MWESLRDLEFKEDSLGAERAEGDMSCMGLGGPWDFKRQPRVQIPLSPFYFTLVLDLDLDSGLSIIPVLFQTFFKFTGRHRHRQFFCVCMWIVIVVLHLNIGVSLEAAMLLVQHFLRWVHNILNTLRIFHRTWLTLCRYAVAIWLFTDEHPSRFFSQDNNTFMFWWIWWKVIVEDTILPLCSHAGTLILNLENTHSYISDDIIDKSKVQSQPSPISLK